MLGLPAVPVETDLMFCSCKKQKGLRCPDEV